MTSTIRRVNDSGFRSLVANLRSADLAELQAGIFRESRAAKSATNGSLANQLAYRYAVHDEPRGNNPQRETLNPSFENSLRTDRVVRTFLALDLDSLGGFRRNVTRAGLRLVANIQKAITRLKSPPKQQATIDQARRRYGGRRQNPLIQTGEMRNAVEFRYRR